MDGTVETDGNIIGVICKLEQNVFRKKKHPVETINAGVSQETLACLNYVEYYGYVLNMYADDVIIYTSAATSDELQMKLQLCASVVQHEQINCQQKKSAVMVIGCKAQLQSLNLDRFSINLHSNNIEFVNKAKYLGLLVKDDLSWDDHIL